jgi:hypothetical protein
MARVQFPAGKRNFFSLVHSIQTSSVAHPASYPMGLEFFPWGKSGLVVKLTTYLHLVPKSRIVELHLHNGIYLHGIVLN